MNFDNKFTVGKILINSENLFELGTNLFQVNDINEYVISKPDSYITELTNEQSSYVYYLVFTMDEKNKLIFSIRRFYELHDDITHRKYVVLYSHDTKTKEITRFECYASISDGSFWRYCVKDNYMEKFEKGYNYVSSTLINMHLQKFIEKYRKNFQIIKFEQNNIQYIHDSLITDSLKNRLWSSEFISKNEVFIAFNEIFPVITYLKKYNDCLIKLLENLIDSTDSNNSIKIDIYSEIYFALKSNNVNKHFDITTDETSRRSFYIKVKKAISDIFLNYFDFIISTKQKMYDKKFKIGKREFMSEVYSIDIVYKSTPIKIYKLYYMIYKINNTKYKNIIHIIPNLNSITPIYKKMGHFNYLFFSKKLFALRNK